MTIAAPFSEQGHVQLTQQEFVTLLDGDLHRVVDSYLLPGTPVAASTHAAFCSFLRDASVALHVHPRSIVIRGSAVLGFSTAPKPSKLWRQFRGAGHKKPSDIDLAIVDADCFERLDGEIQRWEFRQGRPAPNVTEADAWANRRKFRHFNAVFSDLFPPNTCEGFRHALASVDTTKCFGYKTDLTIMVFRDLWSLHNRWAHDLDDLNKGLRSRKLAPPTAARPPAVVTPVGSAVTALPPAPGAAQL